MSNEPIDWEHWTRLDRWELREAVCLLIGVDPDSGFGKAISNNRAIGTSTDTQRDLRAQAERIMRYAWASDAAGRLNLITSDVSTEVEPHEWVRWARHKKLPVPPALVSPDAGNAEVDPPDLPPDYARWRQLELWTLVEASFLLAYAEPEQVQSIVGDREATHRYRELKDAVTLGSLATHASRTGNIGGALVRPGDCIAWALERGMDVPEPLRDLSVAREDKPFHPKEKDSLLKLVIGMAVKGFDYDPSATRSEVPAEITAALEGLGIGLEADTVRKWLRAGSALLPNNGSKAIR